MNLPIFPVPHLAGDAHAPMTGMASVASTYRAARRATLMAGLASTLSMALVGGSIFPGTAAARDTDALRSLPFAAVAQVRGNVHEPFAAFLARTSAAVQQFTQATGYEACGVFALNPETGERGIIITTSNAHVACIPRSDMVPEGMVPTGKNIHAHSGLSRYTFNAADNAIMKALHIYPKNKRMGFVQNVYRFSEIDKAGGSNYLATPNGPIGG